MTPLSSSLLCGFLAFAAVALPSPASAAEQPILATPTGEIDREQARRKVEGILGEALEFERTGSWATASIEMTAALRLSLRELGEGDETTIVALGLYARHLGKLNRTDDARRVADKSFHLAQRYLGENHDTTLAIAHTGALQILGTGDVERGEAALREVMELRMAAGDSDGVAVSRLALASSLAERKDFREALKLYDEALSQLRGSSKNNERAIVNSLPSYARALVGAGKVAEADQILAETFQTLASDQNADSATQLKVASALVDVRLSDRALAPGAAEVAHRVEVLQDRALSSLLGEENRATFFKNLAESRQVYRDIADAEWASGLPEWARALPLEGFVSDFALSSLQKSAVSTAAVAVMAERERQIDASIDERSGEKGRQRAALGVQHGELDSQIISELVANRINVGRFLALSDQQIDLISRISDLQISEEDFKRRQASFGARSGLFGLMLGSREEHIREALKPDEALLFVTSTDRGTHVFAFSDQGKRWIRTASSRDQIASAVEILRKDLAISGADGRGLERSDSLHPFNRRLAFDLYREIVAPVWDVLAGKREVFVALDGPLGSIPLSVLVTALPEGADGDPDALRATRWLGDDLAATQITSITDFVAARKLATVSAPAPVRSFVGYGDPILNGKAGLDRSTTSLFTSRSGLAVPLADVSKLSQLAPLPGTAREIRDLAAAFKAPVSEVRLGAQATEADVRTRDLATADVVAFATHGLIAGEIDGVDQPALVLTPPSSPSETNDGLLTAVEIAKLKLNADWVILSACNTAAGSRDDDAGLSGLAQAFFFAGASSLLVTHWPVRDDVAAEMTVSTIQARQAGKTSGQALQGAIKKTRAATSDPSRAHPSVWAPFSIVGNGA